MESLTFDVYGQPKLTIDPAPSIESPIDSTKEEEAELLVEDASDVVLSSVDRQTLMEFVFEDHAYARPYPVLSSLNNKCTIPRNVLKLTGSNSRFRKGKRRPVKKVVENTDDDDIDIVGIEDDDQMPLVTYDTAKAKQSMIDVEKYLNSLWKDVDKAEEEKISRGSWSKEQTALFDAAYKIVNTYQLAKLTHQNHPNEPVLRKIALEKATKRLRKAFGCAMWMPKHVVWLHGIMIDGLGSSLFLCYLEVLQSLKRKVPALIDRMLLLDPVTREKEMSAGLPNLGSMLRKSWEPSVGLATKVTAERFPTLPFLITIPSGPNVPHQSTKRSRFWSNQLSIFGKPVPMNVPAYRTSEGYVVKHYLEHTISTVRSKICEFRNRFLDRHVVLIGWSVGSLIACKVALLEDISAVICLGFPCNNFTEEEDKKYWDAFRDIKCPVLFMIGSHALSDSIERVEKLRQCMRTQTNLMVLENADELLRYTKTRKRALGLTQNMIDRLIQDEIYLFLKSVLFKPKSSCQPNAKGFGGSPKKKKKKTEHIIVEEKRRKKPTIKTPPISTTPKLESAFALPPLDVSVPLTSVESTAPTTLTLHGLLTTGSVSTTIPVTQLSGETLLTPATITSQTSDQFVTDGKGPYLKAGQKRAGPKGERGAKKTKTRKTSRYGEGASQKFTASLGTHKTGNLLTQKLTNSGYGLPKGKKAQKQQQAGITLQRFPSGSFVLSGATGHVRLQGGTNIVYLQQATSGSTQLIQAPLMTTSTTGAAPGTPTSDVAPLLSQINLLPAGAVHTGKGTETFFLHNGKLIPTSLRPTSSSQILSQVITPASSTAPSVAAALAASSAQQQHSPSASLTLTSSHNVVKEGKEMNETERAIAGILPTEEEESTKTPLSSVSVTNVLATTVDPSLALPSPTTVTSSITTSTIMTHLSANDLRYLASLIAKHNSSQPNSPIGSPTFKSSSANVGGKAQKSPQENSLSAKISIGTLSAAQQSSHDASTRVSNSKSVSVSTFDKKGSSYSSFAETHNIKKISYPNNQKIQGKESGRGRGSRGRGRSSGLSRGGLNVSAANKHANSLYSSKAGQKIPVTVTIPISSLPANLSFVSATTTTTKPTSVPALSAYLAQQRFVLATTKASQMGKTVIVASDEKSKLASMMGSPASPMQSMPLSVSESMSKGANTSSLISVTKIISATSTSKMMSTLKGVSSASSSMPNTIVSSMPLATSNKPQVLGRSPGTITLHLPSQSLLKDAKMIKRNGNEIKLIGVLSPQSKSNSGSPESTSKSSTSSLTSNITSSQETRSDSPSSIQEDSMLIEPRTFAEKSKEEGNNPDRFIDIKSMSDRNVSYFRYEKPSDKSKLTSPIKSSILSVIGDNLKQNPISLTRFATGTAFGKPKPSSPIISHKGSTLADAENRGDLQKVTDLGDKMLDVSRFLNKNFLVPSSIATETEESCITDETLSAEGESNISQNVITASISKTSEDDFGIDFSISPVDNKAPTYTSNRPVSAATSSGSAATSKQLIDVSRILHRSSHDGKTSSAKYPSSAAIPLSKSILELAKARVRESKLKAQSISNTSESEATSFSSVSSSIVTSSIVSTNEDSKLRFEPLKNTGNRSKLTTVLLNNMRDGKKAGLEEINNSIKVSSIPNVLTLTRPALSSSHSQSGLSVPSMNTTQKINSTFAPNSIQVKGSVTNMPASQIANSQINAVKLVPKALSGHVKGLPATVKLIESRSNALSSMSTTLLSTKSTNKIISQRSLPSMVPSMKNNPLPATAGGVKASSFGENIQRIAEQHLQATSMLASSKLAINNTDTPVEHDYGFKLRSKSSDDATKTMLIMTPKKGKRGRKPKSGESSESEEEINEDKEEPYVTRSGRVLRSGHLNDYGLEKNRKRRKSTGSFKQEVKKAKRMQSPIDSPSSSSMASASSLDEVPGNGETIPSSLFPSSGTVVSNESNLAALLDVVSSIRSVDAQAKQDLLPLTTAIELETEGKSPLNELSSIAASEKACLDKIMISPTAQNTDALFLSMSTSVVGQIESTAVKPSSDKSERIMSELFDSMSRNEDIKSPNIDTSIACSTNNTATPNNNDGVSSVATSQQKNDNVVGLERHESNSESSHTDLKLAKTQSIVPVMNDKLTNASSETNDVNQEVRQDLIENNTGLDIEE